MLWVRLHVTNVLFYKILISLLLQIFALHKHFLLKMHWRKKMHLLWRKCDTFILIKLLHGIPISYGLWNFDFLYYSQKITFFREQRVFFWKLSYIFYMNLIFNFKSHLIVWTSKIEIINLPTQMLNAGKFEPNGFLNKIRKSMIFQ